MSATVGRDLPWTISRAWPMRPCVSHNNGVIIANDLTSICQEATSLIKTFFSLAAIRDQASGMVMNGVDMDIIGSRQIEVYNDLQSTILMLSRIPATTSSEVVSVGRVIEELHEGFDFCGIDGLSVLVGSYDRDAARLTSGENDRLGLPGWFSRRIYEFLGWGDHQAHQ